MTLNDWVGLGLMVGFGGSACVLLAGGAVIMACAAVRAVHELRIEVRRWWRLGDK